MKKIGIVGFGFMGKMHLNCYNALASAEVTAICDQEIERLSGSGSAQGNIEGQADAIDLSGIETYTSFEQMLKEADLDAVSITLPTDLHCHHSVRALENGWHVLCEKPMALSIADCQTMIDAAEKSQKELQIGQCIRFWPEYAKTKEIVDSGEYGKLLAASFRRLSLTPIWSAEGWIVRGERSGGAALDLHIHDTDYVQYLLGMPKAVFSQGVTGQSQKIDHIATQYLYEDGRTILAEGGWMMAEGFGFEMSFNIVLEKATLCYDMTRDPMFRVCPAGGEPFTPEIVAGDGYSNEIDYFIRTLSGESLPPVTTLANSRDTVRIALAEIESTQSGKPVALS
jgi:predicted dehydrogenase